MTIRLDDLGAAFSLRALNRDNDYHAAATAGQFAIRPGVYLLSRAGTEAVHWQDTQLPAAVSLDEFVALPETTTSWAVRHEPLSRWITGQELRLTFTVVGDRQPDRVELAVAPQGTDAKRRVALRRDHGYQFSGVLPADWLTAGELSYSLEIHTGGVVRQLPDSSQPDSKNDAWHVSVLTPEAPAVIFQAARDRAKPWVQRPVCPAPGGGCGAGTQGVQISVRQFAPAPSAVSFRHEIDDELDPWRAMLADRTTLQVRARGLEASTTLVEIVLLDAMAPPGERTCL